MPRLLEGTRRVVAATQPPRRRDDRWSPLARVLPPTVLLVLGTVQLLLNPPLWYDEAYTKLAASVPVGTLVSGVWHRQGVISYLMDVPPSFNAPYYLVMHYWCDVFGTSTIALRAPSLLCTAGAVSVLAELGRRVAGRAAAMLCGMLLATGPLLIDEATQARDYGPALLAVALAALSLHAWFDSGRGLAKISAAAAVAALMHWFTMPVIAGFAISAVLRRHGRGGWRAAAALVASQTPAVLLVGWSLAGGAAGAPSPIPVGLSLPVRAVIDWSAGSAVLAVGLTVAALGGLVLSRHRRTLACWLGVPLVLITALELIRASYYPRYLIFTLVWLVLAAAFGIARLPWRRMRLAVAAAVVGLSLVTTVPTLTSSAREPSPAAVELLAAEQTAGQPIVPADGRTSLDLMTYLALAPRLRADLVLPPVRFTTQTTSHVVWLVRVVLQQNSLPVVPAEQRLIDAGWTMHSSTLLVGTTTNLRVEEWIR